MKVKVFFLLLLVAMVACQNVTERQLCGQWQAYETIENNMPLKIENSEIGFEFLDNGLYNFRSTLGYRESGTYSVKGDLLFTLDTVNEASSEKAVRILHINKDSLFLEMNTQGNLRLLRLYKLNG